MSAPAPMSPTLFAASGIMRCHSVLFPCTNQCGRRVLIHSIIPPCPRPTQPYHSINFVIAHDGFTLADLVAYNEKHNAANGEGNREPGQAGVTALLIAYWAAEKCHDNLSWNCGSCIAPCTGR